MAFGSASFNACAPRLPPTTRIRSGPVRPSKRASGDAMEAISARTGLPVHSASFSAPGKATITLSETPASTRLARPAIAFCSCSASGRPSSEAIMPPGNAT